MTELYSCRFDLMAKLLYIKAYDKRYKTNFYTELYKAHIKTFNNCWEHPGTKCNIQDFLDSFNRLIEDMKSNGFNEKYGIPMGNNGIIVNGSHRLVTSYYLGVQPVFKKINMLGCKNYDYFWFRDRTIFHKLEHEYMDTMALEFIKHRSTVRSMILYPNTYKIGRLEIVYDLIRKYGNLYYSKQFNLNNNGLQNLIKEMYRGERWIGGMFPPGCGGKYHACKGDGPTTLILIDFKDHSKVIEFKEACRELYGMKKHSLHIADETIDSFRIGSSLLNKNSVNFLNNGTNNISDSTKSLLLNYFSKNKNTEDFCLTSSLILEMFGLRPAKDLDYLSRENIDLKLKNTGIHNGKWLKYYDLPVDELIYNPNCFFYFNGYKFTTLEIIKKMKSNRKEAKDLRDIEIINKMRFIY